MKLPLNPAQTSASCMQVGEELTLTIRDPQNVDGRAIGVSYDAFVDDVQVGIRFATPDIDRRTLDCNPGPHERTRM